MNDSLYNFSDKSDSDNNSIKMNMDDLFAKKTNSITYFRWLWA